MWQEGKEGTYVQDVHSILAQNRFLEASGNFSTNIPIYKAISTFG